MAKVNDSLRLADLVLLQLIMQYPNLHKHELFQPHGGLWNMSLKPLVQVERLNYVTSDHRFADTIETLRHCNLITEQYPYVATEEAVRLFEALPKSIKRWPLLIPLWDRWNSGELDLDHAIYFENK